MDSSALFSHPEQQQPTPEHERSAEPAPVPAFSDHFQPRFDADEPRSQ